MKLSEFKNQLSKCSIINFVQPNGKNVPEYFHITEVGLITKHFIDCGGTIRTNKVANFQIWVSTDLDHRLLPERLLYIISLSEKLFNNEDFDIEIEYQTDTMGKYGLIFEDNNFLLKVKETECLAKENCGIPEPKRTVQFSEFDTNISGCCTPGSSCC